MLICKLQAQRWDLFASHWKLGSVPSSGTGIRIESEGASHLWDNRYGGKFLQPLYSHITAGLA
jgi:hypothetical protein